MHQGISTETRIALYADDTKIWRSIKNENMNIFYLWSLNNKMKFHPDKCKVVTIKHRPSLLAMLPFVAYHVNKALTLMNTENILTKANQKFGVLKRTCHFFTHSNMRRVVRSQYGGHVVASK